MLKWIFQKWDAGHGLDRSGSGYGQVNTVMNLWVQWNAGNFLSSLGRVRFSRTRLLHGVSFKLAVKSLSKYK
jgi:hypothetical protein